MERALKRIDKLKKQHVLEEEKKKMTPFKVKDFNLIPVIEQWIEDGFQPTLIMVSPPGSGKTQFVKALAWEHGWNLFMVNHKEGIKDLNEEDTGIFFDDVSSEYLSRGIMLALIERDEDRTIRLLYGTVEKKKDFTQIFAFNKTSFLDVADWLEKKEFSRRCRIAQIPDTFINYGNITNNVQINIHNHIYNNPVTIKANQQAIRDIS